MDGFTGLGILPLGGVPRTIVRGGSGMAEWAPDGRLIYYVASVDSTRTLLGVYRVPTAGGAPQLVVRFDVPQLQIHLGGTLTVGNGMLYFVVRELESDIYVMDLVRK